MASEGDRDGLTIVGVDKSDLWATIEWQQSQVHHYQLMARGLVALIITVVSVIIASLTTSLWGPLAPLPTDYSGIESAVAGTPFGSSAGVIIVGFGVFQIFLFSGLFIISITRAGYWFASVIFDYRIATGIEPGEEHLQLTSNSVLNFTAEERLYTAVHRNQAVLERITQSFKSASVRLFFSILIGIIILIWYRWVVEFRIWQLVYLHLFPLIPLQHFRGIPERLSILASGDDSKSEAGARESVFQPYLDSFSESTGDAIILGLITVLNLIVAITVALSLIYSYLI